MNMFAAPKWIVFQLNEICNLRCSMCYQWGDTGIYLDKPAKMLNKLNENTVLKIIEECAPYKPYIGLFGGEPLLYKNIWRIVEKVKKHDGELYIDTNGTTLATHAQKLVESRVDRLWISLDGPKEFNDLQRGKGVYDKVMEGIKELNRIKRENNTKKPEIGLTYIVTPLNQSGIEELFTNCLDLSMVDNVSIEFQNFVLQDEWNQYDHLLKEHFNEAKGGTYVKGLIRETKDFSGFDFPNITRQIDVVRSRCNTMGVNIMIAPEDYSVENAEMYFTANWNKLTTKKSRCALPWTYAEVSADGNVTLCHTFYDNPIGNVNEESFFSIWLGTKAEKIRSYLKKQLYTICTGCCRYHLSTKRKN